MINGKPFITCAVTGAGEGPKKNDLVPITPRQIADDVIRVAKAGAAIAHIHVRDPETTKGSRKVELYEQVVDYIKKEKCDVIINLTAGMGGDLEIGKDDLFSFGTETDLIGPIERLVHVEKIRPDICTLDCGSYNVGNGNLVYVSTSDQVRIGAEHIKALKVRPELEVFDLGHFRYVIELVERGVFDGPTMVQFCLGVPYGAPADTSAMKAFVDMAQGHNIIWSAFGVGRMQMPMVAQAVLLGGNVRVGLEDNLYLGKGKPASNEMLVRNATTIIESMGSQVMSAAECRELLQLKN